MLTRRQFCLTAGALAAFGAPLARGAGRASAPFEVEEVRPGTWAIIGQGGNALLVTTSEGPLLVDAKVGAAAAPLREATIDLGGGAPTLLVNTHHHADHTGGNFAFSAGAKLVAHANLVPRLADTVDRRIKPGLERHVEALRDEGRATLAAALQRRLGRLSPADFDPDQIVTNKLDLAHGGKKLVLRHFGPGHTDNDLAVYFPELDVLHAGDLLFHEMHPFIDRSARASVKGWQGALLAMGKLCNPKTIVIPGHGEVTNATALVKQHAYFDQLRAVVKEAMAAGESREAIVKMTPKVFAGLGGARRQGSALGAMFDELSEG